ncbi:hypothetical protein BFG57_00710 [Bacillus solimangrovi]|uniref:Uncharacterized protein n=1 Tax=Bacillus solimangrovi TaxID=1305675 RepID=A0A1E5LHI2_9BACI|nr:hypothetical protein BFG57_00710 [Bacillus solimangrovi]
MRLVKSYLRGYETYESMIYYINDKYGNEKIFDFIENLRRQDINDELYDTFKVTEEQFIQDWKEYFSL